MKRRKHDAIAAAQDRAENGIKCPHRDDAPCEICKELFTLRETLQRERELSHKRFLLRKKLIQSMED